MWMWGRPPMGRSAQYLLEGLTRIELASSVWKTEALPLSYSPESDGFTPEFRISLKSQTCAASLIHRLVPRRQGAEPRIPCATIESGGSRLDLPRPIFGRYPVIRSVGAGPHVYGA